MYTHPLRLSEDEEEEEEDAGEDSTSHRKETALILVTIFIVRIFIKNSRSHLFKNDDIQPISSHSRTLIHKLTQTITFTGVRYLRRERRWIFWRRTHRRI